MKIYHNARCGTSRKTLALIQQAGIEPEIALYMKEPLSFDELSAVIVKLGINPEDLLRKKEAIFKEEFKGKTLSDNEWIQAMIDHPKLMERPIVVKGEKAILGRPPENVEVLL